MIFRASRVLVLTIFSAAAKPSSPSAIVNLVLNIAQDVRAAQVATLKIVAVSPVIGLVSGPRRCFRGAARGAVRAVVVLWCGKVPPRVLL